MEQFLMKASAPFPSPCAGACVRVCETQHRHSGRGACGLPHTQPCPGQLASDHSEAAAARRVQSA